MKHLAALLPLLVILGACGGVDPSSDELGSPELGSPELGTLELGLEHSNCTVDYDTSDFDGSFLASVLLFNDGLAGRSWRVTWTFRDGQIAKGAVSAEIQQEGADVIAEPAGSGKIGNGASVRFEYVGTLQSDSNRIRSLECTIISTEPS
jgi:hypothetical protein